MSREEAIADIRDNIKPVVGGISLDMAIKALEQEPKIDVLDKIRAEIEEYKSRTVFGIGIKDLETGKQVALNNVLGIIDKYRAEKEQ